MPFTVEVPESVDGVVGALGDGAVVLAGGTQVMPRINTEDHGVATLVSLRRAGLAGIEVEPGEPGRSRIGAATTLARLGADERLAFLRPVVESIASPTIRNLATVGGNLFVAQPYGDLAVALLALDAEAEVTGPGGTATVGIGALLADGLAAGSVVTAVALARPAEGEFFYAKAMRRRLNSASIVTVAAVVSVADGVVSGARIALGGAGRTPIRATTAEAALAGQPFDRAHVEAAATAARDDADPFTDAYASAWYRSRVLPVHVRRALIGE
jgi:CO/xanthine dehydrogenase FAD-binding subunit